MIIGRYLLTELGLSLNSSERVIKVGYRPFEGSKAPMMIWVRMNSNI